MIMHTKNPLKLPTLCFALILLGTSCSQLGSDKNKADPKISKLLLPAGFHAEHLYSSSANDQGSWVAMTFDDKGRMIASDQYGYLYRITIPPIGSDTTKTKIKEGENYIKKNPVKSMGAVLTAGALLGMAIRGKSKTKK